MNHNSEFCQGGIKWIGLREMESRGLPVPPTHILSYREQEQLATVPVRFPTDPEKDGWILRPSPLFSWLDAPKVSGLFKSPIIQYRDGFKKALNEIAESTRDKRTLRQLDVFEVDFSGLALLLQPFLPSRISGLAHIIGGTSFGVVWATGPSSSIAVGKTSGFKLTGSLSDPRAVRGNSVQEADLNRHGDALCLVMDMLEQARRPDESLEIEWLVTPGGRLQVIQAQPLAHMERAFE